MDKFYDINIAGLNRKLLRCPLNDKIDIGAFIMFGDVELTVRCATELLKKAPDFDIILTAESKGIPLAYEMARQSGKTYEDFHFFSPSVYLVWRVFLCYHMLTLGG